MITRNAMTAVTCVVGKAPPVTACDHGRMLTSRRLIAAVTAFSLLTAACSGGGGEKKDSGSPGSTEVQEGGSGDRYEAQIRRTDGGVAHISGDTFADVAFGQGWASGEDHTCDLAEQVVKVKSERARWFGPGEDDVNIDSDFSWAAIGIAAIAAKDWAEADDEVVELMTAYTDGWNGHLDDVGVDEVSGWCAGEEFVQPLEPVDVYAYARSIALLASSGAVSEMLATASPPGTADGAGDTAEAESADDTDETEDTVENESPQDPADEGTDDGGETGSEAAAGPSSFEAPGLANLATSVGSNAWAIGSERSTDGGGMLVGNPHFPWEGELRFWEVHLSVNGESDIYGVQLSGVPGVGIGFTDTFGWSHTVSAGNRFTAYTLDLVDGDPTSYHYGDETREMTSDTVEIEVLGDDDELTTESRTMWRSHYGPMLDFPGFGWSDEATITMRDANIDNDEFILQYLDTMKVKDLDEFIELNRTYGGVPLFNTIATSADGRAWYGDTAATPSLSDEAITAYEAALESDPIVGIAADNGAVLLDGSDPMYEWTEVDGARDPGLVPFDEQPVLERDDYVFNANDSFWVAHAEELLDGDYSPLHGRQGTERSVRTRENAAVLADTDADGPAGDDGTFTLDELADAALLNRSYTAVHLVDAVLARCEAGTTVDVDAVEDDDAVDDLPAATVDLSEACEVLADWDGIYDLDRSGPPLWREFLTALPDGAGSLWAEPFDPADPIGTPGGVAPIPADDDPVPEALARAVQVLELADHGPDVTLGELQIADRNGTLVPIHGGEGWEGLTNVVGSGGIGMRVSTSDPAVTGWRTAPVAPGSALRRMTEDGSEPDQDSPARYPIANGTSFLFALAYGPDGPAAKAFLTYSNTEDRDDPLFTEATEAFSDKAWRDVAFTEDEIEAATLSTTTVRG